MRRLVTKRGGRDLRCRHADAGGRPRRRGPSRLAVLRESRPRARSRRDPPGALDPRNSITIIERRPPWSELVGPGWSSMKIAQLRYDERSRTWSLYAADRNERWFLYDNVRPAPDVGPLLAEIGEDPTGIFWG
ncbi:DUF3024 domain-containing protein [Candidatus Solirubrobacter pratensis]